MFAQNVLFSLLWNKIFRDGRMSIKFATINLWANNINSFFLTDSGDKRIFLSLKYPSKPQNN